MTAAENGRKAAKTVGDAAKAMDRSERLIAAARRLRDYLPGDRHFGDPLSIADRRGLAVAQHQLVELTGSETGLVHELTGGALQVWQAVLAARGQDQGSVDVTLLFTDLVGFSSWSLTVGDDDTLTLLRAVGRAIEPPVLARRGTVVKRLGDGMMAAFPSPQAAWETVIEARERLADIEVNGWKPRIRAGIHTGTPRKLGGDYLGVDVNIAARLVERAGADEVLASAATVEHLDPSTASWRRKKTFALLKVKGVPDELDVYAVTVP